MAELVCTHIHGSCMVRLLKISPMLKPWQQTGAAHVTGDTHGQQLDLFNNIPLVPIERGTRAWLTPLLQTLGPEGWQGPEPSVSRAAPCSILARTGGLFADWGDTTDQGAAAWHKEQGVFLHPESQSTSLPPSLSLPLACLRSWATRGIIDACLKQI